MTPILLLHGFTGSALTMEPLSAGLEECLAMDLPGHGQSSWMRDTQSYTMEATVNSLWNSLDAIGVGKVHLVGYSMGGRAALNAAVAHPDRVESLSVIGASPGIADQAERTERIKSDDALAAEIVERGMEEFVDRWLSQPLFATLSLRLSPEDYQATRRQRLGCNPTGLALSLRGIGTGRMQPLHDTLQNLRIPTMWIAGEEDTKFATIAQEMSAMMPNASFALIPNACHATHLENPVATQEVISDFIQQVSDGRTNRRQQTGKQAEQPPEQQSIEADYTLSTFSLPLKQSVRPNSQVSRNSKADSRAGTLIHLKTKDGIEAWGQHMSHDGKLREGSSTESDTGPSSFEVAMDAAVANLQAQKAGVPLYQYLQGRHGQEHPSKVGGHERTDSSSQVDSNSPSSQSDSSKEGATDALSEPAVEVPVNALIVGDTPEEVAEAGRKAVSEGFNAVKLKVGGRKLDSSNLRTDITRVEALREAVGETTAIRLDTNGTWSTDEATEALKHLAELDIEYVEEPVSGLEAIGSLAPNSPIPVAADESIKSVADLKQIPNLAIPVAVIKPAVLGNLQELFRACQHLQENGIKLIVSSTLDSTIGIAVAAHFAIALGLDSTPCGLATADLLGDDLTPSLPLRNGKLAVPPNANIAPDPQALSRLTTKTQKGKITPHLTTFTPTSGSNWGKILFA